MQDDLPAHQRGIFLAGDDISWTPAWVEGAVQTALNAVWGIERHFGGRTHPDNPGPGDVFAEIGPIGTARLTHSGVILMRIAIYQCEPRPAQVDRNLECT